QMPSCGGAIGMFFFQGLAGIRPDREAPGFKKFVIKPQIVEGVDWVKMRHDSPHGRIESGWRLEGKTLNLSIAIPANAAATVYFPCSEVSSVREDENPAAESEGVKFLRSENGFAVYEIGSGKYEFKSRVR
ncbi:alpha-rhamnosidase, partial [Candidatus Sumerlaeota bacterium]|nr:alpha-rhamnosidase [Candidatus Sumerlaeota bacterium]